MDKKIKLMVITGMLMSTIGLLMIVFAIATPRLIGCAAVASLGAILVAVSWWLAGESGKAWARKEPPWWLKRRRPPRYKKQVTRRITFMNSYWYSLDRPQTSV